MESIALWNILPIIRKILEIFKKFEKKNSISPKCGHVLLCGQCAPPPPGRCLATSGQCGRRGQRVPNGRPLGSGVPSPRRRRPAPPSPDRFATSWRQRRPLLPAPTGGPHRSHARRVSLSYLHAVLFPLLFALAQRGEITEVLWPEQGRVTVTRLRPRARRGLRGGSALLRSVLLPVKLPVPSRCQDAKAGEEAVILDLTPFSSESRPPLPYTRVPRGCR